METFKQNNFSARELEVLSNIINVVNKELNPEKIILFGSRAKGVNRGASDFDVAVDLFEPDSKTKRYITEKLDIVRGLYKIDLVFLNDLEDTFKKLILTTGKIIYER